MTERTRRLAELARVFLTLGATAFGGPAAHIALMEDQLVTRRAWLTRDRYLDLISAANIIPGPNSTEVAMHVGMTRAGLPGLVVAGVCFIAPAAIMVTALAAAYVHYEAAPNSSSAAHAVLAMLAGIKPVLVAIIAQALVRLAPKATPTFLLASIAVAAVAAALAGVHELIILAVAAALGLMLPGRALPPLPPPASGTPPAASPGAACLAPTATIVPAAAATATVGAAVAPALGLVFSVFLKIGATIFGSGYVLITYLQNDLVDRRHWITQTQLLDAIAVGQFTPGPLFTTATFIGYILHGATGAAAATVGIFLPAFILVAVTAPLIPRLRASRALSRLLDAVNAASLALMAVAGVNVARASLHDGLSVATCIVAALALWRTRISSAWLCLAGALVGLAASQLA